MLMQLFVVKTEGSSRLGLRQLCQDCINDLWIPTHLDDEQTTTFALDWFKRAVQAELELLKVSTAAEQNPIG
jgi:hypothetical protein